MKILLFYHSLISDWNHGNAHFLRGISTELISRGHDVKIYEPHDGWSFNNWIKEKGIGEIKNFNDKYPYLHTNFYTTLDDFYDELKNADLVIVHEWNRPELVKLLGYLKKFHQYKLLFHDTHHRSVTSPGEIANYDLSEYDGALVFGEKIKNIYLEHGWAKNVWTWHEAADIKVFHPYNTNKLEGDLVWVGNWGNDERTKDLIEYVIEPTKKLGLKTKVYGVQYPDKALQLLNEAGIEYGGYLPSYQFPEIASAYRFTVHVPPKPYAKDLPGIPTIRAFEAMACGIPMISSPWQDSENLFRVGEDFLMVEDGEEMVTTMKNLLQNRERSNSMIRKGLETIRNRHTCTHRVDELMSIYSVIPTKSIKKNKNLKLVD